MARKVLGGKKAQREERKMILKNAVCNANKVSTNLAEGSVGRKSFQAFQLLMNCKTVLLNTHQSVTCIIDGARKNRIFVVGPVFFLFLTTLTRQKEKFLIVFLSSLQSFLHNVIHSVSTHATLQE